VATVARTQQQGRGPKEFQNRLIAGCHYHPFALNLRYAPNEIRQNGNLPIAIPLVDSPKKFDGLLGIVKEEFRISNIEWVEEPPWEPILV
jgi:hypothetical protein